MKYPFAISFLYLLVFGFFAIGCDEPGVLDPTEILFFGEDAENVETQVGPPPPEIQARLWDRHGPRETLIAKLIALGENPDVDAEFLADWYINVICEMDRTRDYFSKYIDAGGVAIVGHKHVPDAYFIAAKDIIFQMTSKHPEIREKLSLTRFYMAILAGDSNPRELPFYHLPSHASQALGVCYGTLRCYSYIGYSVATPDAPGKFFMNTFVHEFAHVMHSVIRELDPTFDDRLENAYETAKAAVNIEMNSAMPITSFAKTIQSIGRTVLSSGIIYIPRILILAVSDSHHERNSLNTIRCFMNCYQSGFMRHLSSGVMANRNGFVTIYQRQKEHVMKDRIVFFILGGVSATVAYFAGDMNKAGAEKDLKVFHGDVLINGELSVACPTSPQNNITVSVK